MRNSNSPKMIPWSFLSHLHKAVTRTVGANLRLHFTQTETPRRDTVFGVFPFAGDHVTIQLNELMRPNLRLTLIELPRRQCCMVMIGQRYADTPMGVALWRSHGGELMASLNAPYGGTELPAIEHSMASRISQLGDVTKCPQSARPSYLAIARAEMPDGRKCRHAYYTGTCVESPEIGWLRAHFAALFPESRGCELRLEFHTSRDLSHLKGLQATAVEEFWVYLDGTPTLVGAAKALELYREKRIHHVANKHSQQWQTLQEAGIL